MAHTQSPRRLRGGGDSIVLLRTMQHGVGDAVPSMICRRPPSDPPAARRVVAVFVTLTAVAAGERAAFRPIPGAAHDTDGDDSP